MLLFLSLLAQAEPVRVTLSFEDAARHLVDVTASYPASEGGHELVMASWTPGSYKIRDYAKHVEALQATAAGEPVAVRKVAKNRWRIEHDGPVTVKYQVYARESEVQTSFVDEHVAVLNGASLFLWEDAHQGPWELSLEVPERWSVHTALDGEGAQRSAADLDELLDSPLVLGEADVQRFEVAGRPHAFVSYGFDPPFAPEEVAADLARVVEVQRAFWGELPYDRYLFLALGIGGSGGLEHGASTLMMTPPDAFQVYEAWLGMASHEFFHTWNIKRLRPVAYGPFDYEHEVYSPSLWVAEGLTSYYGDLLLHRAGLRDQDSLLEGLSGEISYVQRTPGRNVRSLREASFDAWIKHYQSDENTGNTSISYYSKGQVVGWLLDAEIRRRTDSERSLDDVMRLAFERFAGDRGFTDAEFTALVSEVAGEDLGPWLDHAVGSTAELDYGPALAFYGLQFAEVGEPKPWLGVYMDGSRVRRVVRDSPAWAAGLNVGDELLAVDGLRVTNIGDTVGRFAAGQEVTVLFTRRGRIEERKVALGVKPESYTLEVVEKPSRAQKKALAAWLETPE
ncbi:MAG: M61 family peptidase [Deltaproteobacteria bacterium]|nr:MAG: M61 family peptidase [Deltaproteobacteria bacterium]